MIRKTDKESWTGSMKIKSMMDNGSMIYTVALEPIIGLMEKYSIKLSKTSIKDSGIRGKDKALVHSFMQMGVDFRVISMKIKRMDLALLWMKMET